MKFRIFRKTIKILASLILVLMTLLGFKMIEYSMDDYQWSLILSIIGFEDQTIDNDIKDEQWHKEVALDVKNSIEFREFLIDMGIYQEFKTRPTYEKAMLVLNKIREKNKPFKNENKDKNILHYITACRYEKILKQNLYEKSYEKNETADSSVIEP